MEDKVRKMLENTAPTTDQCFCPGHFKERHHHECFNGWSIDTAFNRLGIKRASSPESPLYRYAAATGELNGCAWICEDDDVTKKIFVNPKSPMPIRTAAHELAHHLLGHVHLDLKNMTEAEESEHEVEVEAVAMLVGEAIGLGETALECSRNYIMMHGAKSVPSEKWEKLRDTAATIVAAGRSWHGDFTR